MTFPIPTRAARSLVASLPLLRTWYIGYVVLVFWAGGHLLWPAPNGLLIDGLIYIVVFLVGYWLWARWARAGNHRELRVPGAGAMGKVLLSLRRFGYRDGPSDGPRIVSAPLRVLSYTLVLLVVVRLSVIAYQILFLYGFRNYLSGASLVFQINDYGRLDIRGGWFVIVTNVLNLTSIAACAYYLRELLVQGIAPRYALVMMLMVGVPILALQRSSVLFGVAFVGVAYIFGARVRGEDVTGKVFAATIAGVFALGIGVYVGLLRENAVNQSPGSGQLGHRVLNLVQGEMSPIVVYATFRADVGRVIDYQYGKPIIAPLLFKAIPRNWYPDKPTDSAAFYALHYQPGAFAAGYALAPTLWGALYLNFGYIGTVLGSFLLGIGTARIDSIYVQRRTEELGWFLIVYYNYYTLLRDDISNVLAILMLSAVVYLILHWVMNARRPLPLPAAA